MSAPTTPESVRILVADDHTLLREALCDLLRSEPGFEIVAQAGNGEDAIRLAAAHRPDVVLLDIEMPRNDPRPPSAGCSRAIPACGSSC